MTVTLGKRPRRRLSWRGTRTATVVDGVATFTDLILSQPGDGYTLKVTDGNIAQTTSSINVTAHRRSGCGHTQSQ